jgi:hypothetical protein
MLKEPKEPRAARSGLERLTPPFKPQTLEVRSSMKGFAKHRAPSGVLTVAIAGIAILELAIAPRGLSVRIGW